MSKEFSEFMKANGNKHNRCSPYHPSSNGEAERLVCTFKTSMKANKYDGLLVSHRVQNFLFVISFYTIVLPAKLLVNYSLEDQLEPDSF